MEILDGNLIELTVRVALVYALLIFASGVTIGVAGSNFFNERKISYKDFLHNLTATIGIFMLPISVILGITVDPQIVIFFVASALMLFGIDTGTLIAKSIEAVGKSKK